MTVSSSEVGGKAKAGSKGRAGVSDSELRKAEKLALDECAVALGLMPSLPEIVLPFRKKAAEKVEGKEAGGMGGVSPAEAVGAPVMMKVGQEGGGVGATNGRKRAANPADLLIMSTVDTKAPPAPPGTNDLLDELVAEHLEQATDPNLDAAVDAAVSALDSAAREEPGNAERAEPARDGDGQAKILQEEIEALLSGSKDTALEQATAQVSETAQALAREIAEATALDVAAPAESLHLPEEPAKQDERTVTIEEEEGEIEHADSLVSEISSQTVVSASSLPLEAPPQVESQPITDEAQEKIDEAEGVLQQELAALMEKPTTMAGESPQVVADAARVAAGLMPAKAIDETPVELPVARPAAEAAVKFVPLEVPEGVRSSAPLVPASAVKPVAAVKVEEAKKRSSGVLHDVALMGAQLLDMPFAWISELDKHIIGVAAFLFLLSGVVLYILAWMLGGT